MKLILLIALLLLSTSLGANIHLSIGDDEITEKQVIASPGDTITLSMKANPSTGFEWDIVQVLKGENKIYEVKHRLYTPDPPRSEREGQMVGRGGIQVIELQINKIGDEILQLIYGRPWLFDKIQEKDQNGLYNVEVAEASSFLITIHSEESHDL